MSYKWWAFIVVAVGTYLGTMDVSGLIVALPTLGQRFDALPETVLWLLLAFTIEPGVYLPDFGVRSEIDLYVGESGLEITSEVQREIVLIRG